MNNKKVFLEGINGDDEIRLVGEKQLLNLTNGRIGTDDNRRKGSVQNFKGNIERSTYAAFTSGISLPAVAEGEVFLTYGTAVDTARNMIIYFRHSSAGNHAIIAYDKKLQLHYVVAMNSQITGGLNFNLAGRVDRNAKVVNGRLYWVENFWNEPRKINIDAGIKANHSTYVTSEAPYVWPLAYENITLIKRPPAYPPTFTKLYNSAVAVNNILNAAFQFSFRYYFRDNEYSVQSAYSVTANMNLATETLNYIKVSMPFNEIVQQDVSRVELLVKYLDTNKVFIVKRWDKNLAADATLITNHNTGTTALVYDFYNDVVGESIDDATATKPFESIPLMSKTLEVGKNRSFLANNKLGYTAPLKTSMTLGTVSAPGGTDITGSWLYVRWRQDGTGTIRTRRFIYLTGITAFGYYFYSTTVPPYPSTLAFVDLTFQSTDVNLDLIDNDGEILESYFTGDSSTVTGASPLAVVGRSIFKTNTIYQAGMQFYDRFRRKCGYVTNDSLKITVPPRTFSSLNQVTNIRWTLSNTDAVGQIPDWAYYCQPILSKCLTTNYFIQAKAAAIKYVDKLVPAGTFSYSTTFLASRYGIAIDISLLESSGMGYTFTEGDLVTLYLDTPAVVTLRVIGSDGGYLHLQLQNIGDVTARNAIFEIFTPLKNTANVTMYEAGQVQAITLPATSSRTYTILTGLYEADIYALQRGAAGFEYLVEAMSPNDKYFGQWHTNAGWPCIFDSIGQQVLENNIAFSNVLITNTRTNGLSSYDALNYVNTWVEAGQIQKLQLSSKQQEDGNVMLVICESNTISAYLGETVLKDNSTSSFIGTSAGVIGTMNSLKFNAGTIDPESVFEYNGDVYWFDAAQGYVIQYAAQGLTPISDNEMNRFYKLYAAKFMKLKNTDVYTLNGFSHVSLCIDPYHKEILVALPKLQADSAATKYPSYSGTAPAYASDIIDRFDVYDQMAKVLGFDPSSNKWLSTFEYSPEWMEQLQNTLYSWKGGVLYEHNAGAYNTIYGVQKPLRMAFVLNENPSAIKEVFNLTLEADKVPDYAVIMSDLPNEQITDLVAGDFLDFEGVLSADVQMDRLSPNVAGTPEQKMMEGDWVRGAAVKIMVEFREYTRAMKVNFVDIGYGVSKGHKGILK